MVLFVAFCIVIFIISTKIKLLGSKKGESIEFEQMTVMDYEMNSNLLPIHHFSKFDKSEITNIMECLIRLNP
jgi:hypothetical protein